MTTETPPPPPTFLALPSINLDRSQLKVTDRTADMGVTIVYLNAAASIQVQISDAADARVLAAAFLKAASLLAPGECPECGALAPGHQLTCGRHVTQAVTE